MLVRKNWREHRSWIVTILIVAALSVVWFVAVVGRTGWERRPTGSHGALLFFGIVGGGICLFEFLLWPRKKYRTLRVGRVQVWMRAHIWLGILCVPILILHSGFWFRNLEATLLFVLVLIVVASGIWGLILQQFIPQKMLDDIPAETIYSQIDHIAKLLVEEGERVVLATCGTTPEGQEAGVPAEDALAQTMMASTVFGKHFTVGAVRVIGGVQGKVLHTQEGLPLVPNSEPLREFFHEVAADYLRHGAKSGSPLAVAAKAQSLIGELRLKLAPQAESAVSLLENLCDQRRQFDYQARLHVWLHSWLWVHLPLSVALIALMFYHIWYTLKYAWPG